MTVLVDWGNASKTISHYHFIAYWTWGEFDEAEQKSRVMLESVAHPVDLLLDFTVSSIRLPANAIARFRKSAATPHPNRGIVVIVNQHLPIARMVVTILHSLTPIAREVHIVSSLTEAYTILGHDDAKHL